MTEGSSGRASGLRPPPRRLALAAHTGTGSQRLPGLDDLALIFLLADVAGTVRWANDTATRLMGRAAAQTVDGNLLDLVHPLDHDQFTELFRRVGTERRRVETVVRLHEAPEQADAESERYAQLLLSPRLEGHSAPAETQVWVEGLDVSDLVRRMHALEIHASQDPLTGLANRTTFMDRLRHELARSTRTGDDVAVLFADVDGLKAVNDTYGHDAGDAVLTGLADRLSRALRPADTLARMGGDEFAVVCPDLTVPLPAMTVADRLRVAAARPITHRGRKLSVTLSIGIAFASRAGGEDSAATLVRRADQAMYEGRRAGAAQARTAVHVRGGAVGR